VSTETEVSEDDKTAETEKSNTLSKTEQEWQDQAMADVEDSLSVRAKADKDSTIVGKMYPTSVATVLKKGSTWTKIESGSVKGYVKTSYLLFGSDAYANAKKVCKTYAYVKTDGLRVRAKAKDSAKVLTTANKGDKLVYNKKADTKDGWVAVTVNKTTGYVAADYVKVKLGTTKALSMDEIAKAKKESSGTTKTNGVSVSDENVNLLAALIQCEAGGESHTGKVAVGAVVLNRMRSSSFPNSISGVIYQSGQFSPVRSGALARRLSGSISSACKQAAQEALAGSDPTSGALYFHRADGSRGQVIGNHVFY
jgi:spore germination cell wall hydrolase CwlJ-like protein